MLTNDQKKHKKINPEKLEKFLFASKCIKSKFIMYSIYSSYFLPHKFHSKLSQRSIGNTTLRKQLESKKIVSSASNFYIQFIVYQFCFFFFWLQSSENAQLSKPKCISCALYIIKHIQLLLRRTTSEETKFTFKTNSA